MPVRAVVLWSGGVESSSILKHLLTNTNYEITAIHICLPNLQNRSHLELNAISLLTPNLKEIRDFDFKQIDIKADWWARDIDVQMALIPSMLTSTQSRVFYRGHCLEDRINGELVVRERIARFVWDWLRVDNPEIYSSPYVVSPRHETHDWPKKQHLEYLGGLAKLTYSCWWPVGDKPCGKCTPCLHIAQAGF